MVYIIPEFLKSVVIFCTFINMFSLPLSLSLLNLATAMSLRASLSGQADSIHDVAWIK